ncbi:PROTEIN CLMP1 [Salix viminalis]|uniref:PROTEIN CLMP1 n=1 Tax=Salix viminalis TaxID=40686 RepID=A0A9Q0SEK3_SALVM|nr:PROTEIN CLMP1 [Salix viminalis]
MGKPTGKKKNPGTETPPASPRTTADMRQTKSSKAFDEDTSIFINMSQELKEEGNRLFQRRDHEGAMLKYEKALKLLPRNHIDVAYLRTNMAACYMQMGLGEYPRAINECNLALEAVPKYSKALLKRARCYEALNRLDLAFRDVSNVLSMEPNNMMGLEISESVKKVMSEKGITFDEKLIVMDSGVETGVARFRKVVKEKVKKKKISGKGEENNIACKVEEKKVENKDKVVVRDNVSPVTKDKEVLMKIIEEEKVVTEDVNVEKVISKTVKLVFGEDIRWAQLPVNCSIGLLRDIVRDRFPGLKGVLMKYRDPEGDLITITTNNELSLDQEPAYEGLKKEEEVHEDVKKTSEGVEVEKGPAGTDDWIVQFARLFKNHVGFDSDSYLDLHEVGMKLYSEAMEDTVTSEEAQELFDVAADKFQEMTALALFQLGKCSCVKGEETNLLFRRLFKGVCACTGQESI